MKRHKAKRLKNAAVNPVRVDAIPPTPERARLGDITQIDERNRGYVLGDMNPKYRVVDALERLFSRKLFDESETMNEAMYLSALWLRETFRRAGLDAGMGSGELDRIVSTGGNFSDKLDAHAGAVDARREFVYAVKSMGWFPLYPYRGAGRVVVAVCCYGYTIEECAQMYLNIVSLQRAEAVAMDRLREGLMTLAGLRRLVASKQSYGGQLRSYRGFTVNDLTWG
jgi:hypothetical protein